MIVALHTPPKGFFGRTPPHSSDELLRLVQKAVSLGFKAVEIGPLVDYGRIEGKRLGKTLNNLKVEAAIHVGGIYDAERFASTDEEYRLAQKQIQYGITLCREISSSVVSVHPPFATRANVDKKLLLKARNRLLGLLKEEVDFANRYGIKMALESFCYHPFVLEGLDDFAQFISEFSPEKLGVLLDAGHIYQIGISLQDAIQAFKYRLVGVHIHDATLESDYRKATHLPIGKGTVDFSRFVDLLREAGYDGWLTLEVRGTEKEIIESKTHLESLLLKKPQF